MTPATWRLGATVAALVLAVLSKGDVLVLAAFLALAAWRPLATLGIGAALVATAWRWSSASLEDIAGAQAVLGSAGLVGPGRAALASWLGGAALLLAAAPAGGGRLRSPLGALAAGAVVALVVFGAAPGGALWQRILAGAVAAGLAWAVGQARARRPGASVRLDALALVAGIAALVAVAPDAGVWSGTLSGPAAAEGLAVGLAAGCLAVAAVLARGAMGQRRA